MEDQSLSVQMMNLIVAMEYVIMQNVKDAMILPKWLKTDVLMDNCAAIIAIIQE
jgi:hypothetical protein